MPLGPAVRQLAARLDPPPDALLVRRFATGRDEAAFAELVGRHAGLVLGVCRRALGHRQDAEDAAQAVFLALARNAGRLRNEGSVAAWLHGAAVRVCRKARARRAKRSGGTALPASERRAPPADEAVAWADARRAIDDALATLPDALRRPLVLCYLQGLTRDEAAARLGWPLSTVRGRLERGRDRLRAELVRRGFPLSAGLVAVPLSDAAAAPGWAAAVARAVVAGPVPPAVSLLACGAVPAMTRWLYLVPAGLLAAGLVWAADPPLKPPPVPQPPAALLKPDPTAKPTPADLRGYWAAEQVVEAGHVRRSHAWRFVDDKHLVWVLAHAQPGVRQSLTTKYRYEPTADGLILHPVERWHGVERWPPKADEKPGEYLFAWDDDRAGFRLTSKTADRDSPWQVMTFRKADEPEAPVPDPLVPDALTKIDRTIKKEPEYADTPVYLLAVVGPEAKFKVWVVLAGKVLYVDRNGNGDLTEDGEAVPQPDTRSDNNPVYPAGDLTDPAGPTHTDFRVHAIPTAGGDVVAYLRLTVGGTVFQLAGPTDLRLAESPKDAQVVHFGSRVVTARPGRLAAPNADLTGPFQVKVGTPGVGPGSFAAFGWRELAEGVGPVAEFAFAPVKPGEAAKTLKLPLTRRVDACEFYDDLTVPDGVKTGLDAATVTLSFPGCPWGEVKPATCAVDVSPKRK